MNGIGMMRRRIGSCYKKSEQMFWNKDSKMKKSVL